MNTLLRPRSVKLLSKFIAPLVEEGLITFPEGELIISALRDLTKHEKDRLPFPPKLVSQKEAAEMLSIGYSMFKKMEREGNFSFKRKMIGTSVRYRNTEIINFIMTDV